jgi:hypothetical protein
MKQQRKVFMRLVCGLMLFGIVCWGVQAASHVLTRASSRVVASQEYRGYTFTINETPVNPNDHMSSMGVHSDGYYYTCIVSRAGSILSTMNAREWKGFRATRASIEPLRLYRTNKIMLEMQICSDTGPQTDVDCMIAPPPSDEHFSAGQIQWQSAEIDGEE